MSEFVLEVKDVYQAFPGVIALNHVKLQLKPGTVHALMGENGAGKSTLMKCMFGIYSMDEGEIYIDGVKTEIKNPLDALEKGIAMVHQELQPIPARTIGENIYLGRYPMKKVLGFIPIVDHEKMYADAERVLKEVKMDFDPHTKVGELSVSQMQSVEIAKAVSANCRVLILDEPTSSLTQNEVEALFNIINDLRSKGVAIVYISHKMDEILRISDEVTIMRDGQYIGTWEAKDLTTDFIITKMVGRDIGGVMQEEDLLSALNSGHLGGACIDTLRVEPMEENCILMQAKNCIITPHIAWAPVETRSRLMRIVAENIRQFLNGTPQNAVSG